MNMMDEVEVEDIEKERILLGLAREEVSWRRWVPGNTLGVVKEWLWGWRESGLGNVRRVDPQETTVRTRLEVPGANRELSSCQ